MAQTAWPAVLWLIRHGESAGNVARLAAEQSGALTIEITGRDVDVPLSALGEQQARAVGRWFRAQPENERPTVLLSSPYRRARQTSAGIIAGAGMEQSVSVSVDERLREKEFGSLNRHIGRRNTWIGNVPLTNARPRENPFIARLHHLLEILVGQQARRGPTAKRRDLCSGQMLSPLVRNGALSEVPGNPPW